MDFFDLISAVNRYHNKSTIRWITSGNDVKLYLGSKEIFNATGSNNMRSAEIFLTGMLMAYTLSGDVH